MWSAPTMPPTQNVGRPDFPSNKYDTESEYCFLGCEAPTHWSIADAALFGSEINSIHGVMLAPQSPTCGGMPIPHLLDKIGVVAKHLAGS
jgi:hypothetical protein